MQNWNWQSKIQVVPYYIEGGIELDINYIVDNTLDGIVALLLSIEPTTENFVHTTINHLRGNIDQIQLTTQDKNHSMLHEQIDMAKRVFFRLLEKIRHDKLNYTSRRP